MSIAVLVQVYDETRRLAIAGSAVAPGDFRLKKLIPPLQTAGEKAPVFAKVAQSVQALVDSNEKSASTALLELTTLVSAILYTQGETGAAGEMAPLETTDLGTQSTQASARVLKPLLEALTSTGSGRIELIRDAHERGAFKDLRLVKPALFAMDDPYSEIGDLVAEKILPLYGKAILPELRSKLDLKEKTTGHLNRLRMLHQLDPAGTRDLVQKALSEGSKEMKVVAVECLGVTEDDINYLLEQSKAKAKDVRAASLRSLIGSGMTAPHVIAPIKNAIAGVDLELIISKMRTCSAAEIVDYLMEQAESQLAETLKTKDVKLQGKAIERLQYLIASMEGRTEARAEAFVLNCFDNIKIFFAMKSEPSGSDLNELVAHVLAKGTPKMQKRLVAAHPTLEGVMLSSAIHAARRLMTPQEFFGEFSPVLAGLAKKKNSAEALRATAVLGNLQAYHDHYFYRSWMSHTREFHISNDDDKASKDKELDPRWLDAAIAADATDLVCRIAREGHKGAIKYLSDKADESGKPHESTEILQAMVRIKHPGAGDAIIAALKKLAKATTYYYVSYWYGRMIPELPKSEHAKFEALLPTLPERMIDQLMESVLELKNKPE